jgi:hypothetical protein
VFIQLKQEWMGRPAGERIDVDEDQAKLLVSKGVADALPADYPVNELIAKTLAHAEEQLAKRMSAAINTALKQFAAVQEGARKHAVPVIFGGRRRHQEKLRRLAVARRQERRILPGKNLRQHPHESIARRSLIRKGLHSVESLNASLDFHGTEFN